MRAASRTTTTHRTAPTRRGPTADAARRPCWAGGTGPWCDPAERDRLFRLRATRVLNAGGDVRFRHWRLYGERDLAGERAAVWVWDETATVAYASTTLAQARVAVEADGHRLRQVGEPRLYTTDHASSQPFLAPVEDTEWHPAQRLAPTGHGARASPRSSKRRCSALSSRRAANRRHERLVMR